MTYFYKFYSFYLAHERTRNFIFGIPLNFEVFYSQFCSSVFHGANTFGRFEGRKVLSEGKYPTLKNETGGYSGLHFMSMVGRYGQRCIILYISTENVI